MTVNVLIMELKKFIEHQVNDYAAGLNDISEFAKVRVFDWVLPQKNSRNQDTNDFPYIVVSAIKGRNNSEENIVEVHLEFGIYDKGDEIDGRIHQGGFYDLMNLMTHVQMSLEKASVIANRYTLQDEYLWEIPEGQPYPYYVGVALAKFNIRNIQDERESEFLHE